MIQVILALLGAIARIPGIAELIKALVFGKEKTKEAMKRKPKKKEKKDEKTRSDGKK